MRSPAAGKSLQILKWMQGQRALVSGHPRRRARRLGSVNKGTLPLGRMEIIDRQLLALEGLASHVFIVGTPSDAWTARGLQVVPDDIPGMGALGGIYTAIVHRRLRPHPWCSRATCPSYPPRFSVAWPLRKPPMP